MPLTVNANEVLRAPSLRLLLEIGTVKMCTEDIYPEGTLGGEWKRLIVSEPPPTFDVNMAPDGTAGVQIEAINVECYNDGQFNDYLSTEKRKTVVTAHLFDKETGELQEDFFLGEVSQPTLTRRRIRFHITALDWAHFQDKIPVSRVALEDFPRAHKDDVGAVIALGIGVGKRIPLRYVNEPQAGEEPHYDYVVGTGNLGLDILWENTHAIKTRVQDATLKPSPLELYELLYRAKQVDGRYLTMVRFNKRQATGLSPGDLAKLTADVQRVYPDVDDDVIAEYKWKGTFDDDIGECDGDGGGTGTPPVETLNLTVATHAAVDFVLEEFINAVPVTLDVHGWRATGDWHCVTALAAVAINNTGFPTNFSNNRAFLFPLVWPIERPITDIQILFGTTNGSAGAKGRFFIYRAIGGGNLYPGDLVLDCAVASGGDFAIDNLSSGSTIRMQSFTVTPQPPSSSTAGTLLLYIGYIYGGSGNPTSLNITAPGSISGILGYQDVSGQLLPTQFLYKDITYPTYPASMPATFPSGATRAAGASAVPALWYRS